MSARIVKFLDMADHAWYRRCFSKLRREDILWCPRFIVANDHSDTGAFEQAAGRIFIDQPVKPKAVNEMAELLLVCAHYEDSRG